jgi:oligopeptide transport system substrate-binding protein
MSKSRQKQQQLPTWFGKQWQAVETLPLIAAEFPRSLPGVAYFGCLASDEPPFGDGWLLGDLVWAQLPSHLPLRLLSGQTIKLSSLPERSGRFVFSDLKFQINSSLEVEALRRVLDRAQQEVAAAAKSPNEVALSYTVPFVHSEKTREVWRLCLQVLRRWPAEIDQKVLLDLQHFLLLSSAEFRGVRTARHMCRIVVTGHWLHKQLQWAASQAPEKRHLKLRLFPARLAFVFGAKPVLGLLVVINIDQDHEKFGQKHLLRALRALLPSVVPVHGSFSAHQPAYQPMQLLYIELEQANGQPFSPDEMKLLRDELPRECTEHIERLTHAIFMHRNEEEVARALLTLSRELQYVKDLPQVMIAFEAQDQEAVIFNVIVVRLLLAKTAPLIELLNQMPSGVECQIDEIKAVGELHKKHTKEGAVFRLRFAKQPFLRKDYSVDLYRARQFVGSVLTQLLGEIRDFNGGLILKRSEVLEAVKGQLRPAEQRQEHLLEKFFYGLAPTAIQGFIPPRVVLELLRLLLWNLNQSLSRSEDYRTTWHEVEQWVIGVVRADERSFREEVSQAIEDLELETFDLGLTFVNLHGSWCLGIVFNSCSRISKQTLIQRIDDTVDKWSWNLRRQQHLRINIVPERSSLDPRLGNRRRSGNLIKMFYEGLTRIGQEGYPELAIAEHIDVSRDRKTYTFFLRESCWSNGFPLTALDFEYAWKKMLEPEFDGPYAYFFYPIKNARAAKQGQVPLSEVGLRAEGSHRLVIELEHPAPYFLDLTANWIYSPLCRDTDLRSPGWAHSTGEGYVCNGPFKLNSSRPNEELVAVKNGWYWDAHAVRLEKIHVSMCADPELTLKRFEAGEIDWLGEPLSDIPIKALHRFHHQKRLETVGPAAVYWYAINTQRPPFNNRKMRQAFAFALNRKRLIQRVLPGSPSPAYTILPPGLSLLDKPPFKDGDTELARRLFLEALDELGMKHEEIGPIVLTYRQGEGEAIVSAEVARQWHQVFSVPIRVQVVPWESYFECLSSGAYHIGGAMWYCYCHDPIYNLEHLKHRDERINNTGWENATYQQLLDESDLCIDRLERREKLRQAEELFVEEMPIISAYCHDQKFIRREEVKGVYVSPLGHADFKWAYIE